MTAILPAQTWKTLQLYGKVALAAAPRAAEIIRESLEFLGPKTLRGSNVRRKFVSGIGWRA